MMLEYAKHIAALPPMTPRISVTTAGVASLPSAYPSVTILYVAKYIIVKTKTMQVVTEMVDMKRNECKSEKLIQKGNMRAPMKISIPARIPLENG